MSVKQTSFYWIKVKPQLN